MFDQPRFVSRKTRFTEALTDAESRNAEIEGRGGSIRLEPERFSRWKNGGERDSILDERDGRSIPRRTPTSTLITPLERLSNDPETFRHLSAVQFNRRTTRRCPPVPFFDLLMACCYHRLRKLHHRPITSSNLDSFVGIQL